MQIGIPIISQWLNSLSFRLAVRTVLVIALLLLTALGIVFYSSRQMVRSEAEEKAMQTLENVLLRMDNMLDKVELAADNMLWNVEHHLDQPDMMYVFSRKILENNPDIIGCAIAFEPNYYKNKDKYFMAYAYHPKDGDRSQILFSDTYGDVPYTQQDWYRTALRQNEAYWVEPFRDYGLEADGNISSYSLPIHTADGEVVGILAVDISMNWFSNTIQETAPFPNSHCSLLGRDGELLVHPDSTKERHRAAYTEAQNNDYKGARKTARAMMAGESGYNAITLDGQDYYVFYKPFENIGWSVAIVCPEEDIFGRYHRMQTYMAIITVAGLLLLLLFIMLTTHYYMKPLHLLTRLARRISEGHYTMSIPINNRQDEISFLQNNFRTMQESLASQINEIEQLSKTLNERNEALKRAYEQGLEADRVKTAFLRNMSDRMAVLINGIGAVVKKLTENYENMPADEMACLVNKMESQSNEAAQLLNQLIDVSLKDKGSIVSDNPNNTEQP